MRRMLKSKIHRATVTQADVQYEGSLSIDRELMRLVDIVPFEEIHVWNVTNGERLTTYAIEAPEGSGMICANGAAAHLVRVGDVIIIASFATMPHVAADYEPTALFVDERNRPVGIRAEIAGPKVA